MGSAFRQRKVDKVGMDLKVCGYINLSQTVRLHSLEREGKFVLLVDLTLINARYDRA
jgi:hypothetical protein